MAADLDRYSEYLRLALPFNSEWGFFDAASYIRADGATQNPYVKEGNVSISGTTNKFYSNSAYFDGSGDSVAYYSPGKLEGDFCLEFWYYATNVTGTKNFFTWGDGSWKNLRNTGGNWNVETASNNGSFGVAGSIVLNAWTHMAVTRSGSSVRFFENGVQLGTTQTSTATWGTNETFRVGRRTSQASEDFQGYMQDVRLYDGVAKYTSNFTAPTKIVDITGDTTGKNFLVLAMPLNNDHQMADVANKIKGHGSSKPIISDASAVISSNTSKFYTKSLYIPGSSGGNTANPSRLRARVNNDFRFGTEDFTIEGWLYADPGTYGGKFVDMRADSSATPLVGSFNGTLLTWNLSSGTYTSTITRNTWQHVALTRQNGTVRAFLNGTQTSTGTNTYDMEGPSFIGVGNNSNTPDNAYSLNGYIQDLRVYKGYAKYTSAFTPHTSGISPDVSMPAATNISFVDSFKVNSYGLDRIVVSGIPQDFTNLIIKYSLKSLAAASQVETLYFRVNGSQLTHYYTDVTYGEGSGTGTFTPSNANTYGHAGYCPQTINSRYDVFGTSEMIIFGYSSSTNGKNILVDSHHVSSDPVSATTYQSAVQGINDGGWKNTDQVVNLEIFTNTGGSFAPGSTFYLYGIK